MSPCLSPRYYISYYRNKIILILKSIFSKIEIVDQLKPYSQFVNASCINLQLPIVILKNQLFHACVIVHDMYINFQQSQVSRSVKTVLTSIFAKIRKLHKFATTIGNFEKKSTISDMRHHTTYMYIKIELVDQSKPCSQNCLQKIANCIKPIFLKEDFIRKSTKHNTKLKLFIKYIQTHHHIEFKHCTS